MIAGRGVPYFASAKPTTAHRLHSDSRAHADFARVFGEGEVVPR